MLPTDTVKYIEVDKNQATFALIDHKSIWLKPVASLLMVSSQTFAVIKFVKFCMDKQVKRHSGDGNPLDICVITSSAITATF